MSAACYAAIAFALDRMPPESDEPVPSEEVVDETSAESAAPQAPTAASQFTPQSATSSSATPTATDKLGSEAIDSLLSAISHEFRTP